MTDIETHRAQIGLFNSNNKSLKSKPFKPFNTPIRKVNVFSIATHSVQIPQITLKLHLD